jgi:flagellar protein FliJ
MKKFKFRLRGVEKLREFKEKTLKMELGRINQNIEGVKGRLRTLRADIGDAYNAQEAVLQTSTKALNVQFFPYYIQGKNTDIDQNLESLAQLEQQFKDKVQELAVARGEVKIIQKLKEKDLNKYKKEKLRKEMMENDDIIIMKHKNEKL